MWGSVGRQRDDGKEGVLHSSVNATSRGQEGSRGFQQRWGHRMLQMSQSIVQNSRQIKWTGFYEVLSWFFILRFATMVPYLLMFWLIIVMFLWSQRKSAQAQPASPAASTKSNASSIRSGYGSTVNLTNDDDSTSPSPDCVWSDPKVKLLDNGGWQCLWCQKIIRTRHSTRALCHFPKIRGNHIAICKAVIPSNWLERYCSMRKRSTHVISAHKRVNVDQE